MKKSFVVAVLLVLFVGMLGIHNFYLDFKKTGTWQLVLSLISIPLCFVVVGFFTLAVVGVWTFVEFIQILCKSGKYATVEWE